MRLPLIILAAIGLASLGMALWTLPSVPHAVIRPAAYHDTGTRAGALAARDAARAALRRVGVIRAG